MTVAHSLQAQRSSGRRRGGGDPGPSWHLWQSEGRLGKITQTRRYYISSILILFKHTCLKAVFVWDALLCVPVLFNNTFYAVLNGDTCYPTLPLGKKKPKKTMSESSSFFFTRLTAPTDICEASFSYIMFKETPSVTFSVTGWPWMRAGRLWPNHKHPWSEREVQRKESSWNRKKRSKIKLRSILN